MMKKKPDDWEKPRTRGQKLTQHDIASLEDSYRAKKSYREAARSIKCSSRVASKYFSYFKAEGIEKKARVRQMAVAMAIPSQPSPPKSRFYRSTFEL